jgi:hypothetical protein
MITVTLSGSPPNLLLSFYTATRSAEEEQLLSLLIN